MLLDTLTNYSRDMSLLLRQCSSFKTGRIRKIIYNGEAKTYKIKIFIADYAISSQIYLNSSKFSIKILIIKSRIFNNLPGLAPVLKTFGWSLYCKKY